MPSSREDRDREILHEALKNLAEKKEPFFDREGWERDQEDLKGAIKDYEKDRREERPLRPLYVAPGVNLIGHTEPFASDSYFQRPGHQLYYRENFGHYTLYYRSPDGVVETENFRHRSPSFFELRDLYAQKIYDRVKPSMFKRIRGMLTTLN